MNVKKETPKLIPKTDLMQYTPDKFLKKGYTWCQLQTTGCSNFILQQYK